MVNQLYNLTSLTFNLVIQLILKTDENGSIWIKKVLADLRPFLILPQMVSNTYILYTSTVNSFFVSTVHLQQV